AAAWPVLLGWLAASACAPDAGDLTPNIGQASQATDATGRPPAGAYYIHIIDVATGLAVFVWGHDFTLLYDGGSNDDRRTGANNRLVAYLTAIGFATGSTINHLILSHPHRDHVELLADVVDQYTVSNVWDSGAMNDTQGYHCFIRSVKAKAQAG